MTILITGATGQVGGAAARALQARGTPLQARGTPLRALVRDPEKAAAALPGAELAAGDFMDGAALARALRGVDTLFFAGADGPVMTTQMMNVLDHAWDAGVTHIVKLSAIGASADSPLQLMTHHHLIDDRLAAGPARWTLLQPHLYMQNLLRAAAEMRRDGRLIAAMAQEALPLVDARDVGRAAAAILAEPAPHAGKTYRITGPRALNYAQVAAAISTLLARPVTYEAFDEHDYESRLRSNGVEGERAFDLAHILLAYEPADHLPGGDYRALTGAAPTDFATFLHDYREQFLTAEPPPLTSLLAPL